MFWSRKTKHEPIVMTLEYLAREGAGWAPYRPQPQKAPVLGIEFGAFCTARCGPWWLFRDHVETLGVSLSEPDHALETLIREMIRRIAQPLERIVLTFSPEVRNRVPLPSVFSYENRGKQHDSPIHYLPIEEVILEAFWANVWQGVEDKSGVVVHVGERFTWAFGIEHGYPVSDSTVIVDDPHHEQRVETLLKRLNTLIFKKTKWDAGIDSLVAMETFFEEVNWEGKTVVQELYITEKRKLLFEALKRLPANLKTLALQKTLWALVQGAHWNRIRLD